MPRKTIAAETVVDLRRRLSTLTPRSPERRRLMQETAALYGISEPTLYRILQRQTTPHALRRADFGVPRVLPKAELERYIELIAAVKVRTSNRKGRHLSTAGVVRLLERYGIATSEGLIQVPQGALTTPTVNRYLKQWGYDRTTLLRPPPAVRFQATASNECWQFDLSPSDLKQLKAPEWMREGTGSPVLMLYSVVDDRSGVAYQEYHGVYGEDVEAALRFLYAAMAPKSLEDFPLQGIPQMIYMDNGPIARSHVFQQVMRYLGVDVRTHLPQSKAGRYAAARAKGKVERPFRSVKEMHETLYHFHEPASEDEANAWLMRFLLRYNTMQHRSEAHSRFEDWLRNLPPSGIRAMCNWERFCTFARDPERRQVGIDGRIVVEGTSYAVDSELAGETVVLWWGLFDQDLYVEHHERRYGPYHPGTGPIPLHRYRRMKKTTLEKRTERIEALAHQLTLPRAALDGGSAVELPEDLLAPPMQAFVDPDPFQEFTFPTRIAAKLAIADALGMPLAKLPPHQLDEIEMLLGRTLHKQEVFAYVRTQIQPTLRR
jgi:hypothetical protein